MSRETSPKKQQKYVPGNAQFEAMIKASELLCQSAEKLSASGESNKKAAQQKLDQDFDKLKDAIDEFNHRPPQTTAEPKGVQVSDELRGHIRGALRILDDPNFDKSNLPALNQKVMAIARGYDAIDPAPPLTVPVWKPSKYTHMKDRANLSAQQKGHQTDKAQMLEKADDDEPKSPSSASTDSSSPDQSS